MEISSNEKNLAEALQPIYILGSGGFAKEVYFLIKSIGGYAVKGFIDTDEKEPLRIGKTAVPVFAEEFLESSGNSGIQLAMGVGLPALITKLSNKFGDRFTFPNLIHPSVIANLEDIEMQRGNIVTANCILTTSICIGSFNIFNLNSTVGHDTVIGNCNVINPGVNISGGVEIGDGNLLGVNSTVLQYKKIGSNCVVGACSLVNKEVISGTTVVGIPARPLQK